MVRARAAVAGARAAWIVSGPGARPTMLELEHEQLGGSARSDDARSTLELSRGIPLANVADGRRGVALARYESARAESASLARALTIEVRATLERVRVLERGRQVFDRLVALDAEVTAAARARVRDELITPLTARLVELDQLRVERRRATHAIALEEALVERIGWLGADAGAIVLASEAVEPESLTIAEDTIAARGREDAPAVLQARARIREREAAERLLAREQHGDAHVAIGAFLERRPSETATADDGGTRELGFRARVGVPLPWGTIDRMAVEQARSETGLAVQDERVVALAAATEARRAHRRLRLAWSQHTRDASRASQIDADLVRVREAYRDGRIGLDAYLAEKDRLTESRLEGLESELTYWEARAALERALGLSFEAIASGATR
ncbi:MAG: TolC family protein [Candidatus Eisenbacteria bacterium]|uniref:TolC family protein n=1 Tax=Eiseniibacteriota bacterium TaxID=2212470 RepID=A0A849SJS7_UNCEI|nr:TolC family protein [Candidatus Eisenbacteria bacterium]